MVERYLGKTIEVSLDRVYLGPLSNKKEDIFWLGVSTSRDEELISLQKEIIKTIKESNHKLLTASGALYHPHFTLMLLAPRDLEAVDILFLMLEDLVGHKIKCVAQLGESDSIGQFRKVIARPMQDVTAPAADL